MASFRFQSGTPVTVTGTEFLLHLCLREEFKDLVFRGHGYLDATDRIVCGGFQPWYIPDGRPMIVAPDRGVRPGTFVPSWRRHLKYPRTVNNL